MLAKNFSVDIDIISDIVVVAAVTWMRRAKLDLDIASHFETDRASRGRDRRQKEPLCRMQPHFNQLLLDEISHAILVKTLESRIVYRSWALKICFRRRETKQCSDCCWRAGN